MNVVREINKINEQELKLGVKGSWHDEYKDSAYVFVGGLPYDLTEGDVITIMSQFGEVIDINMPRDKETGKPKGFSFLMYEDQRSTVLAVDNMNGAQVLGRTIRVDHCKKYEQKGTKNAEGDYIAPEEPAYNAMPPTLDGSSDESSSESDAEEIDEDDPMAAYIRQQKKTKKLTDGKKRKRDGAGEGESKEAHRARKEEKRRRKEERDRKRRERELKKARGGRGDKDKDKDRERDTRAESSKSGRRERTASESEERDIPKRSSLLGREDREDGKDRAGSRDRRRAVDEDGGSRTRYDDRDDRRSRDRDEERYRSRDRDERPRDRPLVSKREISPNPDERDRLRDDRDRDRRRYDDRDRHDRRSRDDDERNGRNGDDRYSRR